MGRPTKEYQAFASLVDRLLTVPKEELDRRMGAYKAEADKNPNKRRADTLRECAKALTPLLQREAEQRAEVAALESRLLTAERRESREHERAEAAESTLSVLRQAHEALTPYARHLGFCDSLKPPTRHHEDPAQRGEKLCFCGLAALIEKAEGR